MLENAKRAELKDGTDAAIKRVLRDARNHEDAFQQSKSTLPLEPAIHADAILDIVAEPRQLQAESTQTSSSQLLDLLRFVSELNPPGDAAAVFANLHDSRRRDELIAGLRPYVDKPSALVQLQIDIEAGKTFQDIVEQLRTEGGPKICLRVASLLVPLLHHRYGKWIVRGKKTHLTRRQYLLLTLSALGLSLYENVNTLERAEYNGPTFPFILAYGASHPSYTQIDDMLQRIDVYLSKHKV
jgi:hypothetical protein